MRFCIRIFGVFGQALYSKKTEKKIEYKPEIIKVLRKIRNAYTANPYLGLCYWFDEFEKHVCEGHLVICEELIKEVQEQGCQLFSHEQKFINNFKGVLYLRKGIDHQLKKQYSQAKSNYLNSLAIQKSTGYKACEGQVMEALTLLEEEELSGQSDPYLSEIGNKLTMVRASEAFLCSRLESMNENHCQIILAAVERNLVKPIIHAFKTGDALSRMMSMATLYRFKKIKDVDVLLNGLQDHNWFVRWRSAESLGQYKEYAHLSVSMLCNALKNEIDPEVSIAIAGSLEKVGNSSATSALVLKLDDSDVDVCISSVNALSKIGNRKALFKLYKSLDGNNSFSNNYVKLAQKAIENIEKRYPLPKIIHFDTYRLLSNKKSLQMTNVYLKDESVICIARLSNLSSDIRLRLHCTKYDGTTVFQKEGLYDELKIDASTFSSIQNNLSDNSLNPFIELHNYEPETRIDSHSNQEEKKKRNFF